MPYLTLARSAESEITVLKSRFIASGREVCTPEAAEAFLAEIRQRYPEASHHCYAYCVLGPPTTNRCSDDGEPSGTAGRPILTVLEHRVSNAMVVVSRYFGGTKLGTGGLVKAYTQATQALLESAGLCQREATVKLQLVYSYPLHGLVEYQLQQQQLSAEFTYAETVTCQTCVPLSQQAAFQASLSHLPVEIKLNETTSATAIIAKSN